MTTRASIVTGAAALVFSLLAGWLVVTNPGLLTTLIAAVVVLAIVSAARPRLVLWVAGAGVLVAQTKWGPPVTSIGGTDVYVGDLLSVLVVLAVLCRPRVRQMWRLGLALLAVLTAWALYRSDAAGDFAFLRLAGPLLVMLAVTWLLPEGYDLRRDLRWFPIAVLISVPLTGGGALARWQSIAGGSNETGLVGALAVALGMTYTGRWRLLLMATGGALLFGSKGITATIAAVAAMAFYAVAPKVAGRSLGRSSLLLVVWTAALAVIVVPMLRVDAAGTVDAHLFQVTKFRRVISDGDPLLGVGWAHVDFAAFVTSDVNGLHNAYLDVFAFLGLVGFVLFLALIVATWRRGDIVTRTLFVAWLVWVNTTGAFPGVAWGVLGFILASAVVSRRAAGGLREEAEEGDGQGLAGAGRGRVDADLAHARAARRQTEAPQV